MSKILLVDDDADIISSLKEVLTLRGHSVTAVCEGQKAMEMLLRQRFDLIISDIVMRGINGVQIARYANRRWPHTEIIMMSGEATDATRQRLSELRIAGFLQKPVRCTELASLADRVLRGRAPAKCSSERIILADDNEDQRHSLSKYLRLRGYKVTAVPNGKRAIAEMASSRFAGIIADVNMPGADGLTVARDARKHNPDAWTVLISGEADEREVRQSKELGVDGFLQKPFSMAELELTLKDISVRSRKVDDCVAHEDYESPSAVTPLSQCRRFSWYESVRQFPLATVGFAVALIASLLLLMAAMPRPSAAAEGMDARLDRLIRAVEADWGR